MFDVMHYHVFSLDKVLTPLPIVIQPSDSDPSQILFDQVRTTHVFYLTNWMRPLLCWQRVRPNSLGQMPSAKHKMQKGFPKANVIQKYRSAQLDFAARYFSSGVDGVTLSQTIEWSFIKS